MGWTRMIVIIDYNAGNLTSVARALKYLNIPCKITAEPEEIINAEKIIFPGVGNAESAMQYLKEYKLDLAIKEAFRKGIPIMGICLGTQIILSYSEEGATECLGLISGKCSLFKLKDKTLKIPHMGWNEISIKKEHYILKDLKEGNEFYFVHSYYPEPAEKADIYAVCNYEIDFPAVIGYKNLIGTQFHPEKSGPPGLQLLKNFFTWDGGKC